MKDPCVYIVTNRRHGTLYTGVTSNLSQRVYKHRTAETAGFTQRYGCTRLMWYERFPTMGEAIARENQLKGGSRAKKVALIVAMNPPWADLYDGLAG